MPDQRLREAYLALAVSHADDDGAATLLIPMSTDGDLRRNGDADQMSQFTRQMGSNMKQYV
jgi:hypothetical protein